MPRVWHSASPHPYEGLACDHFPQGDPVPQPWPLGPRASHRKLVPSTPFHTREPGGTWAPSPASMLETLSPDSASPPRLAPDSCAIQGQGTNEGIPGIYILKSYVLS